MTGREHVRAAPQFKGVNRAPRDLWALPYVALFRRGEMDAVRAAYPGDIDRFELSPGADDAAL